MMLLAKQAFIAALSIVAAAWAGNVIKDHVPAPCVIWHCAGGPR